MNFVRAAYPLTRMRRNRASSRIRNLVAESHLAPADLIWPLFITDGSSVDIPSLPGVRRLSLDDALLAAAHAEKLGIAGVALFPATDPKLKDAEGTEAWNHDNLVCRALRAIRAQSPDLLVMCDVALDPYTDHGQDGVFRPAQHHQTILDQFGSEALAQSIAPGGVANDASIDALVKQAMTLVESGCRVLAPSDMMDGRVGVLRRALDGAGYTDCLIISYAAKYASNFYAPFRDAVGSAGALRGDKKTYQMDPRNSNEALHEVALDLNEGADIVMVKPAMPYLDIIAKVSEQFAVPVIGYQVSGEYAMLKQAGDPLLMESLQCIKRAGASGILTYFAPSAAQHLVG